MIDEPRIERKGGVWFCGDIVCKASLLSSREAQLLLLCVHGFDNRSIADRMSVKTSTISKHWANIFYKFGVRSAIQAVVYAIKNKIVILEHKPD